MLLGFFLSSPLAAPWFGASSPADLDGDGQVGITDLLILLSAWGLDGDCTVGITDLVTSGQMELIQ